jgi:hypothetical protein
VHLAQLKLPLMLPMLQKLQQTPQKKPTPCW